MLNVLGHFKHAWPKQRGGSEVAAHRVLAWLAERGHDVNVAVSRQRAFPTDGVHYEYTPSKGRLGQLWAQADVVLTHQAATRGAIELSEKYGVPVLHWAHNWSWFPANKDVLRPGKDIVLWNTEQLAVRQGGDWAGDQMVLHPPAFPSDYSLADGDKVLQVNLNALKGADVFWRMTERLPELRFQAVVGGWMPQVDRHGTDFHWDHSVDPLAKSAGKNVQIVGTTTDMAGEIYPGARVLMVPTGRVTDVQVGESWGLVAAEATHAGIPVVATRSPGMVELLGDSGILIDDPTDLGAWEKALVHAAGDGFGGLREKALARSAALDPVDELLEVQDVMMTVAA